MYHVEDGLYFSRIENSSRVRIIKRESSKSDTRILFDITVNADIWASIVSSVSILGENAHTFSLARSVHMGPENVCILPQKEPVTD